MSLRALDLRSRLARKTTAGQSVKDFGDKDRKKADAETKVRLLAPSVSKGGLMFKQEAFLLQAETEEKTIVVSKQVSACVCRMLP